MKGLLNKLGQKLGQAADSIAAYNAGEIPSSSPGSVTGSSRIPVGASKAEAYEQNDPVLEHLLRNVRSKHVRTAFFKTPPTEYTERKDVRILAGSYNVNGKKPAPGTDLRQWLGLWDGEWPTGADGDAARPDILAVGFQEIVPLNAGNVIVGSATSNLEGWDRAIGAFLNGEAWAAVHHSPSGMDAAQAGQVLNTMDAAWQGGAASGKLNSRPGSGAPPGSRPPVGIGPAEGAWVQIVARQMVGLYMSVWVRRSLLQHVRGVQATATATGFGGWAGNKGAVVVRMRVYDSPLALVCAHLSAGEQEGDELRRNADVLEILRRTDFGPLGDGPGSMATPAPALVSGSLGSGHWGAMNGVADMGSAIWVGDLNYRLAGTVISDDDARVSLRAGRLAPLLDADQLGREMAAGRVFKGWREGPITFPPTFKFKVGTSIYLGEAGADTGDAALAGGTDPEESAEGGKQKRRTPAWCDRVLWLNTHGCLHQLSYRRSELAASDHKPVAAAFLLQARHYDRPALDRTLQEARRVADMTAAMQRPKCSLSPNQVTVNGTQRYREVTRHTVKLTNTGAVEGMWHFVPPPGMLDDEAAALPPWLSAIPAEGVVPAGESCDITLEICVRGGPGGAAASLFDAALKAAHAGGLPIAPLEAIVILRVEDGGDMFLCANASVELGFIGAPLASLLAAGPPAAALPAATWEVVDSLVTAGAAGLPALGKRLASAGPPATPTGARYLPVAWAALLAGLLKAADDTLGGAQPDVFIRSAQRLLGRAGLPVRVSPERIAAGDGGPTGTDEDVWAEPHNVEAVLGLLTDVHQAARDAPDGLPAGASPDALAALLGVALADLPQPLLPPQLLELCNTLDPALGLADRVLSSCLGPSEAALLLALRGLFDRLHPQCAAGPAAAGGVLAELLAGPKRAGVVSQDAAARRAALAARLLLPLPASLP